MKTLTDKQYYLEMVDSVREKLDRFSESSFIRQALTESILDEMIRDIGSKPEKDLLYAKRCPIFGFVDYHDVDAISKLESDLALVLQHSDSQKKSNSLLFLHSNGDSRLGDWYGGLFDVWIKSFFLKKNLAVDLDFELPNGRDTDIRMELGNRYFHLESTVITQDDESREVWDRWIEDKRNNSTKSLIRPGPYCPPNAKGPSLYYDTRRFYAKVYDKLAKNLDPEKTQCAQSKPNILLISVAGPGVRANSPGFRWALDELFANQPNTRTHQTNLDLPDISLNGWLEFTANELIRKETIDDDYYCDNYDKLISAPRKLSGIILFDNSNLVSARINYNANEECLISHAEMAELEKLFDKSCDYWL